MLCIRINEDVAKCMDEGRKINVIAIDPGTDKCGLAVHDGDGQVCLQEVVAAESAVQRVAEVAKSMPLLCWWLATARGQEGFWRS